MATIAIVGGGLAGLTAAHQLASDHRVGLLEASPRLGGQLLTSREHGFVIERGAEGFVARSLALPALCNEVGLGDALLEQAITSSYGFDGSALVPLAPGEAARFLGFQVAPQDLGKGIMSLSGGMGTLIDALRSSLNERVELRVGREARELRRAAGGGIVVQLSDGELVAADAAVVAVPARVAARLLRGIAGEAAESLSAAPTVSSVTVELAYERAEIAHPLDGTGFVVASDHQHHGVRACTFTSSKFEGRAPAGKASLRVFFRPEAGDLEHPQDEWVSRARGALARVLGLQAAPLYAWVSTWPDALPVFSEQHKSAVARLEQALAEHPIALAGAAFHGSGIDAAVRSAERAAAHATGASI